MNYSITVVAADKVTVQETNETMLSVLFNIVDEAGTVVKTSRQGFPLDIDQDTLNSELAKNINTFVGDTAIAEKSAELEAANAKADKTISAVVGTTVIADQVVEAEPARAEEAKTEEAETETI